MSEYVSKDVFEFETGEDLTEWMEGYSGALTRIKVYEAKELRAKVSFE